MINFVYTIQELRSNHGRDKRCNLYRIKKNVPHFVGTMTDSFVDDGQLAVMTALHFKQINASNKNAPKSAASPVSYSTVAWKDAGIARFTKV